MSSNLPLYVLAAPLLTAFAVNMAGRFWRGSVAILSLGALFVSTICALLVLQQVLTDGTIHYTVGGWRAPWGIELVIDPLSALMLVLIAVVALLATFSALPSARKELPGREHLFFTHYLILISGLFGLVVTGDAFNLYVMLEITSITTYCLIAMGPGRAPLASFNYIIMGTIGACFYLLGVGYLYILTGSLNMADIKSILPGMYGSISVATGFAFLMVGVWIKMAFLPLHGWLPNAYTLAPSSTSVLIAPLMTKVAVFLMIRVIFSIFSPDYAFFQHVGVQHLIVWAAALAILIASGLALAQTDLKRMLSYIIVAEVGYMVGGVWLANTAAMTGAILHIVNDALMTLCLFLAASAIVYRLGDSKLTSMKGLYRRMPLTMAAFTIGAFSMIGVPPTAGFFSKWYLILGGIQAGSWAWIYVAALLISSLVNAILFFRIIEIAYFQGGGEHGHDAGMPRQEACTWQLSPLLLSAVALLAIGLASGPLVEHLIIPALPAGF